MDGDRFWRLTLMELFRDFAAIRERRRDDLKRDLTLAWNVVRIYAMTMEKKRMPKLTALLAEVSQERARPQSVQHMRATLALLSETYGYPLRSVN